MTDLAIGPGTRVTLHFSLKLESGETVDSNFDADPAQFTVGDGSLLEGFEESLFGLNAGDEKTVNVGPEKGFGQRNPNNIQEVPREHFAEDMELAKGLIVSFADAQQTELPGVIAEFDEKVVTVDFNHPLAGETIAFQVKIVAVEPAQVH
ncbi:MAG: peptidylprolyl isomerase [Cellvibrionaceae bacterium]